MSRQPKHVLSLRAESPGLGYVRWVRSGRLHWLPEIGPTPIPAAELSRREARLAERIRRTLGSSPYEPVTMDPDEAADLLATVMGTVVTREEGPLRECACADLRELKGREADDYADKHLAFVGLGRWELDEQTFFRCPVTGVDWVMTFPGPTPHGYHEPLLVRA